MCINPRNVHCPGSPYRQPGYIQVPCGKCIECKIQYQNAWMIRLIEEAKCHKYVCMVTLTYNEASVPYYRFKNGDKKYRSVYARHVQDWIKRFRTNYDRSHKIPLSKKFKYFITSEYGPKTFRPHYHAIFYGLDKFAIAPLLNDWRKRFGFVHVSWIPQYDEKQLINKMRYVAKYCSKGEFECPYVEQGYVAKTFHLVSKRLGYGYLNKLAKHHLVTSAHKYLKRYGLSDNDLDEILSKRVYILNGFAYKLPRYYCNKIFGEQTWLSTALSTRIRQKSDDLHLRQLAEIQTERNCSEVEASYILNCLEDEIHKRRYLQAKKRYEAFLNKSKI